jgi:TPR repeat protein
MDIKQFITMHNVDDHEIKNYDETMIERLNQIVSGKVDDADNNMDNPILCYYTGLYYMHQNKHDLAERYLRMVVKETPKEKQSSEKIVQAMYSLGSLYDLMGKHSTAKRYYLMAVKNGCGNSMIQMGMMMAEQKKYKLAKWYYEMAVENGYTQPVLQMGLMYCEKKKYSMAEKCYQSVVGKETSVKYICEALNRLAELYILQEKDEDMINQFYQKAADLGDISAMLCLGKIYEDSYDMDNVVKYYQMAVDLGCVDAMIRLGKIHYNNRKYDEAVSVYQHAIDQGNLEAMNELGRVYCAQDKDNMAVPIYQMAVDLGSVDAMYSLGLLYKGQQNNDQAVHYFLMAVKCGSTDAMYRLDQMFPNKLKYFNMLMKIKTTDEKSEQRYKNWIEQQLNHLRKIKTVRFFENKIKLMSKIDCCPICYEDKLSISRECAHFYCTDCYIMIDRCALCEN